jgi:ABC-2 type transport system permease protein
MAAYLQIFITTIKEYAAYRLNFVLWRLRMLLNLLFSFFLWSAVFDTRTTFGSYGKTNMISYILYVSLISTFVMGSRTGEIAYDIQNGAIINMLLKPVDFFRYYLARDLADKTMNIFFAILELLLVVWLFKAVLVLPQHLVVFVYFFINGVFISFFINLMLSFIAFFTQEIWAPRFLFTTLVFFVSGSYFPLNLLPGVLYRILLATPFPYLFSLPSQMLSGNIDRGLLPYEAVMSLVWVFLLYRLTIWVWHTGNRNFSFWGR